MNPARARFIDTDQRGSATATKVFTLVVALAGATLFATSAQQAEPHAAAPAIAAPSAAQAVNDPDAELREWLREPQPPTF